MAYGLVKGATVVGLAEQGTAASGTITIANNTIESGDKVTINGVDFVETTDFVVGGSASITATNLANAINNSQHPDILDQVTASALSNVVTITAVKKGLGGNAITLAETDTGTNNFTLSGSTLTGGSFQETVAAVPASSTDYVQVLNDGFEISPAKELKERQILTSSIGKVSPRASTKSVSGSLPIEFRAAGVEGQIPQYDLIIRSALGARRKRTVRVTSGSGHTTSVINVTNANKKFKVYDMVVILQSGAHHVAFVSAVASGSITIFPVMPSTPSNGVEIAKCVTYLPANANHPVYTVNGYWGNEIREQAIGCRSASMSIENFTTGDIPTQKFQFEGVNFDEVDGVAPHTPSYDAGLPPLALCANIYQDGSAIQLNELSVSVENTVGFLTSVTSCDGRISGRITERKVSGKFNPYKDDTSVTNFTKFSANTLFSLVAVLGNHSTVAGEYDLGSIVAFYLPNCLLTDKKVGDADGILVEDMSFSANRGTDGTSEEIIVGFC